MSFRRAMDASLFRNRIEHRKTPGQADTQSFDMQTQSTTIHLLSHQSRFALPAFLILFRCSWVSEYGADGVPFHLSTARTCLAGTCNASLLIKTKPSGRSTTGQFFAIRSAQGPQLCLAADRQGVWRFRAAAGSSRPTRIRPATVVCGFRSRFDSSNSGGRLDGPQVDIHPPVRSSWRTRFIFTMNS